MASRIAAGEVVENPASAVKELLENSLDAGASEISVEINDGGLGLIRVVDNGVGIPAQDATLAFQRFATSKIPIDENLDSINTLGFRGEALPSIAAVSTVYLVTSTAHEPVGTLVEVIGGEIGRAIPYGSPIGTSIAVKGLFQNFPGRLKFLKSRSTETSRIQALLHRFALAFPYVRLHLQVDGRLSFASSGGESLRDACSDIYGPKIARALLEVKSFNTADSNTNSIDVDGLVSPPDISRASRGYINIFVNHRWIQSRHLAYAVEEAYKGLLMERRYPLAAIHLTIPAEDVDINVHPSKLEVRFRQEREVFSSLQRAVRDALIALAPVPIIHPSRFLEKPVSAIRDFQSEHSLSIFDRLGDVSHSRTLKEIVPTIRALGQVHNLYIVAEGAEGIYLIDQHAAHERVRYDRIQEDIRSRVPQAQGLLEAVVVDLDSRMGEALEAHLADWAQYGFDLEAFGPDSYLLRAIPATLMDMDPRETFLSILGDVADGGSVRDLEDKIASSVACHSSVRAGKTLSQEEMAHLLAQLESTSQPNTCPHGRPTMILISADHLHRQFGRR